MNRNPLWDAYRRTRSNETLDALLCFYRWMAVKEAGALRRKLPPWADWEALEQAGMIGLAEAIRGFDPTRKNVKFETYATLLIRGRLSDEMRDADPLTRTGRRTRNKIDAAESDYFARTGDRARDDDVAEAMGLRPEEINRLRSGLDLRTVASFSVLESENAAPIDAADTRRPRMRFVEWEDLDARIRGWGLPNLYKQLLRLRFAFDLSVKELAFVFEVSETRISQIIAQVRHQATKIEQKQSA